MAGENFSPEVLQSCRNDAARIKTIVWGELLEAIAAAEMADLDGVSKRLNAAQMKMADLRLTLEDLAYERERQIDAEGEQCTET